MIIVMSVNEQNMQAAKFLNSEVQIYPDVDLKDISADTLILFDLNLDGAFSFISPYSLAEELIANELPHNVKKIKLIVGNLKNTPSLTTFVQIMANYLAESYKRQITFYVTTNINYAATLIVPPENTNKEWSVYGSPSIIENPKYLSAANLLQFYPHFLLWKGENISHWLEQSKQREFKNYPI